MQRRLRCVDGGGEAGTAPAPPPPAVPPPPPPLVLPLALCLVLCLSRRAAWNCSTSLTVIWGSRWSSCAGGEGGMLILLCLVSTV